MNEPMHFIIDWTNANALRELFEYLDEEGAFVEAVAIPRISPLWL